MGRQDELYVDPFLTESESSRFRRAIGRVRHPSQKMGDEKNEPGRERLVRVGKGNKDVDILRRRLAERRRVGEERDRREHELAVNTRREREKEDELTGQMNRDKEDEKRWEERRREREKKGRPDDWEMKGLGQPNTPDRDVDGARTSAWWRIS